MGNVPQVTKLPTIELNCIHRSLRSSRQIGGREDRIRKSRRLICLSIERRFVLLQARLPYPSCTFPPIALPRSYTALRKHSDLPNDLSLQPARSDDRLTYTTWTLASPRDRKNAWKIARGVVSGLLNFFKELSVFPFSPAIFTGFKRKIERKSLPAD